MLKLLLNEKKHNAFISFWEISSIEEYNNRTLTASAWSYFFFKLDAVAKCFLCLLMSEYTNEILFDKKDNNKLAQDTSKLVGKNLNFLMNAFCQQHFKDVSFSSLNAEQKQMLVDVVNFLDTIHLITLKKNRSILNSALDEVVPAPQLLLCFNSFMMFSTRKVGSDFMDSTVSSTEKSLSIFDFTDEEKKVFTLFDETGLFANPISKELRAAFVSLVERRLIIVACNAALEVTAFISTAICWHEKVEQLPNNLHISNVLSMESYPSFLYAVEKKFYGRLRKKKIFEQGEIKAHIEKKASIIVRYMLIHKTAAECNYFIKKNFRQKSEWLFKTLRRDKKIKGLSILLALKHFSENAIGKQVVVAEQKMLIFINNRAFCDRRQAITKVAFQKALHQLELLCLLNRTTINKEKVVVFFADLIRELCCKENFVGDIATIDGDSSILIYKNHFSFSALYCLYRFCRVSVQEHVVVAMPIESKILFAYFCDISPEALKTFLKSIATNRYHVAVENYIDYLFKQTQAFKKTQCMAIHTHSEELFKSIQHYLTQKFLNDDTIIFIVSSKTIVFSNETIYQKAICEIGKYGNIEIED